MREGILASIVRTPKWRQISSALALVVMSAGSSAQSLLPVFKESAIALAQQQELSLRTVNFTRWKFNTDSKTPRVVPVPEPVTTDAAPPPGQDACGFNDFIQVGSSGDSDAALFNRHKYCAQYTSTEQTIQVELMRNAADNGWEWYNPAAGRPPATFVVGHGTFITRIQAYGSSTRLAKTHRMQAGLFGYRPNPEFPLSTAGVQLKLLPYGGFQTGTLNSSAVSNVRADPPAQPVLSLALRDQAVSEEITFDITVSWTYTPNAAGDPDMVWLSVYAPGYQYTVRDTPRPSGFAPYAFASDNSSAWLHPQWLRCDRGVAVNGSNGCIMANASPVLILDANNPSWKESARHVYWSQRTLSPGQSVLSPGRFKPRPTARAVAWESGEPEYMGLERTTSVADENANRNASCTLTTSLFRSRPYQGSEGCPTMNSDPDNCSCDEYPFARTRNGGAFAPNSTAVRGVLKIQNTNAGGELGRFVQRDRVLPYHIGQDKYWVEITGM